MATSDLAEATPQLAFAAITARLAAAPTLSALAPTLAADAQHTGLPPFDHCCLLLAAPGQTRLWLSACVEPQSAPDAAPQPFAVQHTALAPLLAISQPQALDATAVQLVNAALGDGHAASALWLPLAHAGQTFGALCLLCAQPDAYTPSNAQALQWLATVVALTAQALLAREQLDAVAETERELARLKSGFVNTLVRDVRVPLAGILALLDLFESKLSAREPFDMEDRQLLLGAVEQGAQMRRLLDDLLEVAQQHERPLAFCPAPVAVPTLLAETTSVVRGMAAMRGIELDVQVQPGTPMLEVDARQVRRALSHMLDVALAATPHGGMVTIAAHGIAGTRRGESGRHFVIINVTDTSAGIPAAELPFVFDAFWQATEQPRHGGGRGVGLVIAKRIAAAHGGNVAVRSQPGAGTTYSIVLPANAPHATPACGAPRVLIVEDTPDLLVLLGKLIERMGYEPLLAENPRRALELLEAQPVDLLLTDWAMPEISGGELIARVKTDARWRTLPTIVLTGHDAAQPDAQAAGCDRFLVKPIMRDELQAAIATLLQTPAPLPS